MERKGNPGARLAPNAVRRPAPSGLTNAAFLLAAAFTLGARPPRVR